MAKILHFEDFLSKRELADIETWAREEFAAPVVNIAERRKPIELRPLVSLKQPPPKAA